MQVINIVDNLQPVNFGIWNAALATVDSLRDRFGVDSILVAPNTDWTNPGYRLARTELVGSTGRTECDRVIDKLGLALHDTIVVTHGAWRFATRWGARFAKAGAAWVYVPHGMLEPWSLQQRRLRKRAYFSLIEGPLGRQAQVIRAVGRPEWFNLQRLFPQPSRVELIPNGIPTPEAELAEKDYRCKAILFLGRLHEKKCVARLVEAFTQSSLANNAEYALLLAGPDQGELSRINEHLAACPTTNVEYLGAVYGEAKEELLRSSCFFALPSQSEGFPTSVVEAMGYGCLPMISDGCNFPEAAEANLCVKTETSTQAIQRSLEQLAAIPLDRLQVMQRGAMEFVAARYSTEHLAEVQFELYRSLLNGQAS